MICPTDGTTLLMSERQGVEIDYCPQCRGIWLDRGELDKILERVQAESPSTPDPRTAQPAQSAPQPHYQESRSNDYRDSRSNDYRDSRPQYNQQRKKNSPFEFLGDLFG